MSTKEAVPCEIVCTGRCVCIAEKEAMNQYMQKLILMGFYGLVFLVARSDWKDRKILNRHCLEIFIISFLACRIFSEPSIYERVFGSMIVSLPMLFLGMVSKGSFGGGDVKITAAYGFFLGVDRMVKTMFLAVVLVMFFSLGKFFAGKGVWREVPLGVFLAMGIYGTSFL